MQLQGAHKGPRILKFLSALQADLVRPLLDGEDAAQLPVMVLKDETENPQHRFYKSSLPGAGCAEAPLLVPMQGRSVNTKR